MEQITNEIKYTYSDPEINGILKTVSTGSGPFSRHYNQVEEFFLHFEKDFTAPHLPVHHDVRRSRPDAEYIQSLTQVLGQLVLLAPQVFDELTYLFDPGEILKPCFFKLYRIDEKQYLYLLRLDLMYRPQAHTIIDRGSNDFTARYSTRDLFLEAVFIPLDRVIVEEGKISHFLVNQTISNTWVDETGRGYFVQGIWIDNELTKFFSRLFLPPGKKSYPFYPYICKYKTICQSVIRFSPESRKALLPYLHRALNFLEPVMGHIESSMKNQSFSEDNETFKRLKQNIPETCYEIWETLALEVYLNEQDMREFRIED
ncbi:hypothetical protein ES703_22878 [subsurface metagenome]